MKDWLSQVSQTSWHYRLIKGLNIKPPKKACVYYWICIPRAIITAGTLGVVFGIVFAIIIFGGFVPNLKPDENSSAFYPYKSGKNGRWKIPIAPWEVVATILILWGFYELVFWVPTNSERIIYGTLEMLKDLGLGIAGLALLVGLAYLIINFVAKGVMNLYERYCPPLIIVGEEVPAEEVVD